ncbi:MAG TPA: GerAB/ArcD/ProY family transporter [Ruminiclostridium sp.]|nr:GerAB/ArcD/ProY family transporter [Ruminiclostridium sp.]
MEKISRNQLFCLIMMGQLGSTNLWALGIDAKRDAWIVDIISTIAGMGVVWLYTSIYSKYPEENIVGVTQSILGKILGWPLGFIYFLVYTFNATRTTSEFADLINVTFLQDTPSIVIKIIFYIAIIYVLFLGIETMGRIAEIIFPITMLLIILIYIMIVASGQVKLKELLPIYENGYKPILKAFFPIGINFPFGLVFVFFQFWKYNGSAKTVRKTTYWALALTGINLTVSLIIMVSSLGINFTSVATIPFLEVIKLISIGDIITNLDAIGVILVFVGGFYLTIFFYYSAVLIFSSLFGIKDYRWVLIPLAVFIMWYTGVYEPNYPFHVKYLVPQYWQQFVSMHDIVPICLLLIYYLKKYCKKNLKMQNT